MFYISLIFFKSLSSNKINIDNFLNKSVQLNGISKKRCLWQLWTTKWDLFIWKLISSKITRMAGILINHNIMTVKQWNTFLTQYIIFKHVEPPFPRKTTTHCKPIPASEPFSKPSLNHPPNFKLSFRCFLRRFQFRNSRLSLLPPLLQLSH